jgi:hypothetical protein
MSDFQHPLNRPITDQELKRLAEFNQQASPELIERMRQGAVNMLKSTPDKSPEAQTPEPLGIEASSEERGP